MKNDNEKCKGLEFSTDIFSCNVNSDLCVLHNCTNSKGGCNCELSLANTKRVVRISNLKQELEDLPDVTIDPSLETQLTNFEGFDYIICGICNKRLVEIEGFSTLKILEKFYCMECKEEED